MNVRIGVSLLTAESREIYIGEHIAGRHGPLGDRACRGGTEIIVIASDKPCNVDEILLYARAAHDFAPLSPARMEGSIFDRRNNPFSPIALYFCIRRAVDHGAYRAFAPPSTVYARVKARVGLSGKRLECEFPVKAGIY